MPALWFLDYLGKSVVNARVRKMCALMELSDLETRLILERFCERKNAEQCDFYSPYLQKKHLPDLDCRVRGWVEQNVGFFSLVELGGISRFFNKRQSTE